MRRYALWLLGAVVLLLSAVGLGWLALPAAPKPPAWGGEYDVAARRPETLPPGLVIGTHEPAGWSHLVIKSLPRVKPSERSKVNALTAKMATWMFTVFAADVIPERHSSQRHYRLRAVGLGLGANSNGQDVIITTETAERYGIEMNWITREILTKAYATQEHAVMAIHGPSFGLMDTPVWFRCGDKHERVRYRYALLVDPINGQLDVLMWSLGASGYNCDELRDYVRIARNTIDEAELVVDPNEITLGVPSEAALAVDKLPTGARHAFPSHLRSLAGQTRFTVDEAAQLEAQLRGLPH